MPSKQNLKAINAWQAENLERIVLKPSRKEHISDRIAQAVALGKDRSRQSYILNAVRARLDADGIPQPDSEGGRPSD